MRPWASVPILLSLACGVGPAHPAGGSSSAVPLLTGDTCGVYADAASCVAAGCQFAINTRPCLVGQPCPAGWCFAPGPTEPPSGPVAGCACAGTPGDVCVLQLGGPPTQVETPPDLSCRPGCRFFATPTPEEVCSCLAEGLVEQCRPSGMVTNLCACDDGIR